MAQVKDQDVATVDPSVAAPDQSLRVQVNPDSFGAPAGEAVAKFGQQLSKTSEYFGQVQTDDAINSSMERVNGLLTKYRTTQGREALDSQQPTKDEIDDVFKQGREGLKLGPQQVAYDNAVRSYRSRYVDGIISSHAEQAARVYTKETNDQSLKVALGGISNVAEDDDHVEVFKEDARRALVRQVVADGNANDPAAVSAAIATADRYTYKTQAQAVAVKDPVRALALVEKHREILGLDYPELANSLRARVTEAEGLAAADEAIGSAANEVQKLPPTEANGPAVRQAILEVESGNKSTAPTSVDGAVGPGQVLPETFKQFAKPGEDINDPAANRAVSSRYIDHLSALPTVQGDPARIAVGYFSGEGNIAPIGSATPWVRDLKDGNGQSTSAYVQAVTGRMNSQGAMLAAKASAYDLVMAKTAGRPEVQRVALAEVARKYQAAQVAAMASQQAQAAQREASLRQYGDLIRSGQGAEMPWRNDPNLTETQIEHLDELAAKPVSPGNGPGYSHVHADVLSGKIVNAEQLLSLTRTGALTAVGYSDLVKMVDEFKKPGAEGERLLLSNFYTSAQRKITLQIGEGDAYSRYVRPERQKAWDRALPVLNQAIAAGRAKGLTDAQLLNPDSKDSVWPALQPFLPSPSEVKQAQIEQDADIAGRQAPDLSTKRGLRDAVRSGALSRAKGERIAIERGWVRGANGPAVPQGDAPVNPPDVKDLAVPPGSPEADPSKFGLRQDGTPKGAGFLGLLRRPDGDISSEISIGVNMDGREVELPLLVPTLSRAEVDTLLGIDLKAPGFFQKVPRSIVDKAVEHARARIAAGKSPFAGPDESLK